ncbi:hypothetical protein ANN_11523 [Periplaneta americana]|uniref:Uncharacterized protein n=1 Tax=Periplaneta americana TaxID=6978 RepID=A0ABQ8T6Z3_PERAM|nr:hypothetical protein ANN_11523 [Periplaneta americana]
MGESRNAYRVLVGRPEGKRLLGRPRRRWKNNIKMDLREVAYNDRDRINLAQDRDRWRAYMRAAMNLRAKGKEDVQLQDRKIQSLDVETGQRPNSMRKKKKKKKKKPGDDRKDAKTNE